MKQCWSLRSQHQLRGFSSSISSLMLQYLQAFSWLKFQASAWEQESILMPDTSSQTTISGKRMQQHARPNKKVQYIIGTNMYLYYLYKSKNIILVKMYKNEKFYSLWKCHYQKKFLKSSCIQASIVCFFIVKDLNHKNSNTFFLKT